MASIWYTINNNNAKNGKELDIKFNDYFQKDVNDWIAIWTICQL